MAKPTGRRRAALIFCGIFLGVIVALLLWPRDSGAPRRQASGDEARCKAASFGLPCRQ